MDSEELLAALEEHLRFQSEPELLLLKGHLILEQGLNQLLRAYVTNEAALERMNLSFSRKLDLLCALGHTANGSVCHTESSSSSSVSSLRFPCSCPTSSTPVSACSTLSR